MHLHDGETNDDATDMKDVRWLIRSIPEEMTFNFQEMQFDTGEITNDTDAGPAVAREINFFLQEMACNC